MNSKIFRNKFTDWILNFPKISALLSGSLAKFLFCKGWTCPLLILFVVCVPLFLISHQKKAQALLFGFLFGIGYFGATLYWVAESFYCVGMNALAYPAVSLLVLYLSIYFAFTFFMTSVCSKTQLQKIFFFAFFWAFFEYLRGIVFTGFPWNLISYATYDIPFVPQFASVVGPFGLSFLTVLFAGFWSIRRGCYFGILGFLLLGTFGYFKIQYSPCFVPTETFQISIVQPSIPQEEKNNFNLFRKNIEIQLALSGLEESYTGKKLIIWPEAAINVPINQKNGVLEYVSSHIKHDDVFLVTGADFVGESNERYNGLAVICSNGRILQTYHKRHLLPFGEFLPDFLSKLGLGGLAGGINYSRGKLKRTIEIPGFQKFDSLICFEIAFSNQIVDNKSSGWILNITNDSWFKDSDGPSQHLVATCFRAIEEGKPVVRCANNGISCVIDCDGQILQKLETDKVGRIETQMPQKSRTTLYSKF